MAADLAALEGLRAELLKMNAVIYDPRASAGTKRRATRALGNTAIAAVDTALALLRDRQATTDDEALV